MRPSPPGGGVRSGGTGAHFVLSADKKKRRAARAAPRGLKNTRKTPLRPKDKSHLVRQHRKIPTPAIARPNLFQERTHAIEKHSQLFGNVTLERRGGVPIYFEVEVNDGE